MSDRTEAFKQELDALLKKYDCELCVGGLDGDEQAYFYFSNPHDILDDWKIYD
jgi:hypothetical protein|tara:strand:+ start:20 stop:178 length:159 start_codon:yes stop_codon:yes gene_type:complete